MCVGGACDWASGLFKFNTFLTKGFCLIRNNKHLLKETNTVVSSCLAGVVKTGASSDWTQCEDSFQGRLRATVFFFRFHPFL